MSGKRLPKSSERFIRRMVEHISERPAILDGLPPNGRVTLHVARSDQWARLEVLVDVRRVDSPELLA